jgi:beta-galactosidase
MQALRKCFLLLIVVSALLRPFPKARAQQASRASAGTAPDLDFPTVLYGVAYYNEYMPGDQAARLDKDVALMKAAGLNVVRMGESTWSLWEPEDGQFEYAWMDRVVDAMGKAGIKVILGTPTYSIPAWMAHQHPEIFADRIPPGMFGGKPLPSVYGLRQNMDTDSPAYRFLRRAPDSAYRRPLQGQSNGDRLATGQRNLQLRCCQSRRVHWLPALSRKEVRHS